jgi:hypothetical protein
MRRAVFCLVACGVVGTDAFAQAGVRTEDPQGMFHVDAKANTVVVAGSDTLNVEDDVIVTGKGNLGIGTIPPALSETKLVVTDGGTPAAPRSPLRILDGKQAEGHVLTSDAGGRGQWTELPAGFSLGEVHGLYGIPARTTGRNPSYTDLGISFTANESGFYAFEVRWWARVQNASLAGSNFYQHFRLMTNGSPVDQYEVYTNTIGGAQEYSTMSFTLYSGAATKGQTFTLNIRPYEYMVTQNNASEPWTRAWVNIVRLY